jgi:CubicO group peptidase (beta-lactamase class C family)
LALSLTLLAGRALPSVLEEQLMDRIGASSTWQWLGYWNSWVDLNGTLVQAVSGGSHWGGGMYISSRDLARFGLLYCRRGRWELAQVLPSIFIERTFEPGPVNRNFGLLWWLNTDQKLFPTLPDTGACAYGFGSNILWIDPAVDLVVVARWYHGPSTGYLLDSIYRALAP